MEDVLLHDKYRTALAFKRAWEMNGTLQEVIKDVHAIDAEGFSMAAERVTERYLSELALKTGNDVIVYISGWEVCNVDPYLTMINHADTVPFIEMLEGFDGSKLDLIIHSPGGVVEAARAWVHMIREQYEDFQVSVTNQAMSAATMVACAGNELHMASHSFLGPTDPQVNFRGMSVPAQGIVSEFENALHHGDARGGLSAYGPLIEKYQPGDLYLCRQAVAESKDLVKNWLNKYLLRDLEEDASVEAARMLNENFRSHSRLISRGELKEMGFPIIDMEVDEDVKKLKMKLHYACKLYISTTIGVCKVIASNKGQRFLGRYTN